MSVSNSWYLKNAIGILTCRLSFVLVVCRLMSTQRWTLTFRFPERCNLIVWWRGRLSRCQTKMLSSTAKLRQNSFYKTNNLNVQIGLHNLHKTLFHSYTFRLSRAIITDQCTYALVWSSCKLYKINYVALFGRNNIKIIEDDKFSFAIFTCTTHNQQMHNTVYI